MCHVERWRVFVVRQVFGMTSFCMTSCSLSAGLDAPGQAPHGARTISGSVVAMRGGRTQNKIASNTAHTCMAQGDAMQNII